LALGSIRAAAGGLGAILQVVSLRLAAWAKPTSEKATAASDRIIPFSFWSIQNRHSSRPPHGTTRERLIHRCRSRWGVSIVGLVYNSTSQVLVVNADKIKSYDDFKNPQNSLALNARGDFIYI